MVLRFMFARVIPCCSGKHCNKLDMYRNGQVQNFCACHQMCSRSCKPGIAWGLNLTTRVGDCISIYDSSSTSFLFDWIFKRRFLCRIRAYDLDDYHTLPLIETAGIKVIDEVNRSGGCNSTKLNCFKVGLKWSL